MKKKRIFRQVLSVDPHYQRYDLGLECGHRLEWTRLAKRKACPFCELIVDFSQRQTAEYNRLLRLLQKVPMDDRANVMIQWIRQIDKTVVLIRRSVNPNYCLALSDEPCSYPLLKLWENDDSDPDHDTDSFVE